MCSLYTIILCRVSFNKWSNLVDYFVYKVFKKKSPSVIYKSCELVKWMQYDAKIFEVIIINTLILPHYTVTY